MTYWAKYMCKIKIEHFRSTCSCLNIIKKITITSIFQAEIDGRYRHYVGLQERGEKLVNQRHYSSNEVEKMGDQLKTTWTRLNETWDEKKEFLTQSYDLQVS